MGDLVNLRTARKQAKRRHAAKLAADNRLLHGIPKAERVLREALQKKARTDLDRHRIDKIDKGER